MKFFHAASIALAVVFSSGCGAAKATQADLDVAAGEDADKYEAYVWSPQGEDYVITNAESFIMIVGRSAQTGSDTVRLAVEDNFVDFAGELGYDARKVNDADFRTNYPVVLVDQVVGSRKDDIQVTYRNRDHRAIVRFYIELMVASSGNGVADTEFGHAFMASAM